MSEKKTKKKKHQPSCLSWFFFFFFLSNLIRQLAPPRLQALASANRLTFSASRRRDSCLLITNGVITEAAKHGALDDDKLRSHLTTDNKSHHTLQLQISGKNNFLHTCQTPCQVIRFRFLQVGKVVTTPAESPFTRKPVLSLDRL